MIRCHKISSNVFLDVRENINYLICSPVPHLMKHTQNWRPREKNDISPPNFNFIQIFKRKIKYFKW